MKNTSRLCVKNLPKHMNESRLKEIFSEKGHVTDVRILKKGGVSRRFGFVGFRDPSEASIALSYFNGTYLDTSKVIIEYAKGKDESGEIKSKGKGTGSKKNLETPRDEKLEEFLSVVKGRNAKTSGRFWSNDDSFKPESTLSTSSKEISEENEEQEATEVKYEERLDAETETGRLFVRNLPFSITDDELQLVFGEYGEIENIHIPLDDLNRTKGYAFIQYGYPESAVAAMNALDQSCFQGRIMHVLPGRPAPKLEGESLNREKSSFKKTKQNKLKTTANQEDIWNTLFIRQDTAVSSLSNSTGLSKSQIMLSDLDSKHKTSDAVKVALVETNVIASTKKFLVENGVSLESFSGNIERSSYVILAKNLPNDVTENDLYHLFGKFGQLGRVLLAPSGVLGFIEFLEKQEAKKAFQSLAYSKYKSLPLYLEWAPVSVFTDKAKVASKPIETTTSEVDTKEELEQLDSQAPILGYTLFVKNLSFDCDEKALTKFFSKCGDVKKGTIAKHKKNGELVSLGYGFVEFLDSSSASAALKTMQNSILMGHTLKLSISRPKSDVQIKRKREDQINPTTKLIVKNLPFEASKKELRQLFSSFGEVKSIRLPKKFGGGHRGFAFVDFISQQEANNCYENLKYTHFYGRHLVLQWASVDEDVLEKLDSTKKQKL